MTSKETWCFQTGLWGDSLAKRLAAEERREVFEVVDVVDEEEPFLEEATAFSREECARVTGEPLISFCDSGMGWRLTNSFCSNWTTT